MMIAAAKRGPGSQRFAGEKGAEQHGDERD